MRYHDFHLREYRVSDFGKHITLDLVYDYAGKPKERSQIEFSDVALYNFTHTLVARSSRTLTKRAWTIF